MSGTSGRARFVLAGFWFFGLVSFAWILRARARVLRTKSMSDPVEYFDETIALFSRFSLHGYPYRGWRFPRSAWHKEIKAFPCDASGHGEFGSRGSSKSPSAQFALENLSRGSLGEFGDLENLERSHGLGLRMIPRFKRMVFSFRKQVAYSTRGSGARAGRIERVTTSNSARRNSGAGRWIPRLIAMNRARTRAVRTAVLSGYSAWAPPAGSGWPHTGSSRLGVAPQRAYPRTPWPR